MGRRTGSTAAAWFMLLASIAASPVQDRTLVRPDAAERRLALVIGNNNYAKAPLRNAVPDATDVSSALREVGFDVTTALDTTLADFERVVETFVSRLQRGDIALFFYSGHGIQINGDNYLIPVDFNGVDEADAKAKSYSATRLQEKLEARSRIRLMILDACRDNPFKTSRSGAGGLAGMQGQGSLIAFATAAGSTASDNPRGKNGLFTEHLLDVLRQPGLSSRDVFFRVRERVHDASGGRQFPWVSDGLIGDFMFRAGTAAVSNASPISAPSAVSVPEMRVSRLPAPAPGGPAAVVARALAGDSGAVNAVAVSPGSVWVAAGLQGGIVKLWDPRVGREVATLKGQVGAVGAVAFSPDGRHLAASSADQTVRLWDIEQQVEEGRLVGHGETVHAVAYSPNGRIIATASADQTVRLWDSQTAAVREVLSGHRDTATSVAFSADGVTLVSGGRDRTIRVWSVARARETLTIAAAAGVLSIAVSRDGGAIVAGHEDGTVAIYDAETGQVRATTAAHKGPVWSVAFNHDGQLIATGGADALVRTWGPQLKSVETYRGHANWVRSVTFDSTGTFLASAGGDGDVRTWLVKRVARG